MRGWGDHILPGDYGAQYTKIKLPANGRIELPTGESKRRTGLDFFREQKMIKTLPIQIEPEKITEFCQRHHIRKLSLFGSVLREDFRPDSDVDFVSRIWAWAYSWFDSFSRDGNWVIGNYRSSGGFANSGGFEPLFSARGLRGSSGSICQRLMI